MFSTWVLQLAFALLAIHPNAAPAAPRHALGTHREITSKIVQYTIANGLVCQDATRARVVLDSLLQIGTLHEDDWTESTDSVRAQVKARFGRDVSNETLLLLGQTLVLGRFNFHFTPRLTDGGVNATCSSRDWAFGNAPCTYTSLVPAALAGTEEGLKKVTVTLRNRFNWDAAVAQAKEPAGSSGFSQGFVSLGYVLHLFEDLTSPAHSRNDAHAWTDPEWMEYRMPEGLVEEWKQVEKLSGLPENVRTPAMPAARPLAVEATGPTELFDALHGWVSSNFYSKSTVKFMAPGPLANANAAYSCASALGATWLRYICDEKGRLVAKGDQAIIRVAGITTQLPNEAWIDSYVADAQWKELGPRVVRDGSRLVMMYIRAAAPTMPCTVK
jgi:hypothetical protein